MCPVYEHDNARLVETYREQLQKNSGDEPRMEKLMEDIEESHYMDGYITSIQFESLFSLYQELTGDYSVLRP